MSLKIKGCDIETEQLDVVLFQIVGKIKKLNKLKTLVACHIIVEVPSASSHLN